MKNDIKKLYRKDSKLAIQVAKALGMKIKVKANEETKDLKYTELPTSIQKTLKVLGLTPNKISQITYYELDTSIYFKKNLMLSFNRNKMKYLLKNKYFTSIDYSKEKGVSLNFSGKSLEE